VRRRRRRVRQAREVLRAVGVQAVLRRPAADLERLLVVSVLHLDAACRQQASEVREQAPRYDRGAAPLHGRLERCAQRQLHIGGGEFGAALVGSNEDPAEDLHGRSRRDTPADNREFLRELFTRARELEAGTEHRLYVSHICKKTFRSS
jgi:hypothetical protein